MDLPDVYIPPDVPAAPESGVEDVRRTHVRRSSTENVARIPKRHLALLAADITQEELDEAEASRPRTRGDCQGHVGPCGYVSCKYNLFLDVTSSGNITYNFPGKEIDEIPETCALDVADRGGATLNDVGELLQLSRERIRQVEQKIFVKLKRHPMALRIFQDGGFEHANPSHLTEDHGDGGGGGTTTIPEGEGRYDKTPDEQFSEKVDRIYERTSRERAMGIRADTPVTMRSDDDVPAPPADELESHEDLEPPAPESPPVSEEFAPALHDEGERETPPPSHSAPPAPKENRMGRPLQERPLTDRERAVVDAYLTLSKKVGGKPLAGDVGRLAKLKGAAASISANVCTALTAARKKGVELPFISEKPVRSGVVTSRVAVPTAPRRPSKKVRQPREEILPPAPESTTEVEVAPADPTPSTAMVPVVQQDAFKTVLQTKREVLLRQIAAIDTLLAS